MICFWTETWEIETLQQIEGITPERQTVVKSKIELKLPSVVPYLVYKFKCNWTETKAGHTEVGTWVKLTSPDAQHWGHKYQKNLIQNTL